MDSKSPGEGLGAFDFANGNEIACFQPTRLMCSGVLCVENGARGSPRAEISSDQHFKSYCSVLQKKFSLNNEHLTLSWPRNLRDIPVCVGYFCFTEVRGSRGDGSGYRVPWFVWVFRWGYGVL